MNRNETNRFATNPVNLDISRSTFNRDHKVLFSGNVGDCICFYLDECLPGDTFSVDTSKVVRLQPLVTPIFDNLYLDTYYFYVPTRLLWDHWKQFNGENTETAWVPEVTYTIPQIKIPSGGFNVGTIADYLGVPPKVGAGKKISALPFRAYAKVMDDWFRDENLMNPVHLYTGDNDTTGSNGSDQVTDIEKGGAPFVACKYFDYFTACIPGAMKSNGPSVEFALRGLLPVDSYTGKTTPAFPASSTPGDPNLYDWETYHPLQFKYVNNTDDVNATWENISGSHTLRTVNNNAAHVIATSTGDYGYVAPYNLFADLSNTPVFDINELRTAFAIQRFYEKQARGGSRYIEYIKAFFNVDSPDARLQRSEYLGGNRLPLNVSSVEQTSASESGLTPQGNLTGISATGDVHSDFTKSFTEHGYILGIAVVRYHHTYQQGIERHWLRKTLFDYYNTTFANLGEQGVKTWELCFANDALGNEVSEDDVFGYQEAWADYRYKPSRVAGEMRSCATTPLDSWHLADYYDEQPYLSDVWIREDKTMLDRCLAVTSSVSNQFMADFYITCQATRPMPLYSIPGLIDHH